MIFGSVQHVRVFVYRAPVDMRKAYDTLAALVEGPMGMSLVSGDVFVFIGRTRKSNPHVRGRASVAGQFLKPHGDLGRRGLQHRACYARRNSSES